MDKSTTLTGGGGWGRKQKVEIRDVKNDKKLLFAHPPVLGDARENSKSVNFLGPTPSRFYKDAAPDGLKAGKYVPAVPDW